VDRSPGSSSAEYPVVVARELERRRHVVFTGLLVAFLVALLLLPVFLIGTRFYARHSNYLSDAMIDFKGSLAGADSDTVVYGDSSALYNVVPAVINKATNLSVYNLGYVISVFTGAPNLMLDRYLQMNKSPRTIILYISPTTGVYNIDLDSIHYYETAVVLERFASLKDVLKFYLHSPQRIFGVAAVAFRNLLAPPQPTEEFYKRLTKELSNDDGWIPSPDKAFFKGFGVRPNMANTLNVGLVADARYITEFKKKYQALGAKVLVYVSPIPECPNSDISVDDVKSAYRNLADNEPYSFPCDSFTDGFHLLPQAATANSMRVASFLSSKLNLASAEQ